MLNHIVAQHEADEAGGENEQGQELSEWMVDHNIPAVPPRDGIKRPHVRKSSRRRSSVLMEEWKAVEYDAELRQWRNNNTTLHDKWTTAVAKWQLGV